VHRSPIRPPRQRRSQDAWNRILEVGVKILREEGREALTITEVCRRANVAPMALYARVDGIAGLFWAIHDREMTHVISTYEELLIRAGATRPGSVARIRAIVGAICETFHRHGTFLHQIINISVSDPALRSRASRESLVFIDRIITLLPHGTDTAAHDVARMLHQECIFRALFGDSWLTRKRETYSRFRRRLLIMALCRLGLPA